MKNKAYVLLSLAGILWGFQPVVVKFIVAEMNPPTLVSFRYLLLSATLFLLMKITHKKDFIPPKSCWLPLIIMGITGVSLNNGSQFTGLQYSTVANATLIAAMTPAVTSLLAFVFLRERLALLQWIGIIISISGTLYLISNGNLDIILHISFNLGDILFFVAQLSWAIYCLISIRVMKKMSVLSVTAFWYFKFTCSVNACRFPNELWHALYCRAFNIRSLYSDVRRDSSFTVYSFEER